MLKQEVIDNMQHIVDNCMGEENSGCVAGCPMHTDAKGYIDLIREGEGERALKLIRETLFLPGTLGRICAHPCQKKCKWMERDNPIQIAALKRYAADNFDEEEFWDIAIAQEKSQHIGIIGAGPAGAQAAIDLRKEGYQVTIYERQAKPGGVLMYGIPAYRLPREVVAREYSYLEKLGVKFCYDTEVGKTVSLEDLKDQHDALIIAVGKSQGIMDRQFAGTTNPNILEAISFLDEAAKTNNVKQCKKKVVVIGGGDVAMDCSRTSFRVGADTVTAITLELTQEEMPASAEELEEALEEGVNILNGWGIKALEEDEHGNIKGVHLKKCMALRDDMGNFSPQFDENNSQFIECDTLVFAIGQKVETGLFDGLVEKKGNGLFECDQLTLQTSDEKIFVAGDASGHSHIVIMAMATGRRAATSIKRYLEGEDLKADRILESTSTYDTKLNLDIKWEARDQSPHQTMNRRSPAKRIHDFGEVAQCFTPEQAQKESERCLQCECKLCMKECVMLRDFTTCPKALFRDFLEKGEDMDRLATYSCNDCSQCTIVCPKDFNIKDNFMAMRKDYSARNNGLSPHPPHAELERTQALECSTKYCTMVKAQDGKPTKYVLMPGCTVPGYIPDIVEKILVHMKETLDGEVGAVLQCCGKITKSIGEEDLFEKRYKQLEDQIDASGADIVVTLCPSCYKIIGQHSKHKVVSYWELMRDKIGVPQGAKDIGKGTDVVFNIQDPCTTRDIVKHHESIRWLLDEMGYPYEEMNCHGERTRCCGVGGMVFSGNPPLYEKIAERRAADCTQDQVVTYCGSCRGTLEMAGKDSLHILDLLYGDATYMKDMRKERSVYELWDNRLKCKENFEKYKD